MATEEQGFDPNRTPYSAPAPGYRHIHSVHGKITINEGNGIIQPIENGPNYPVEIPVEYVDFDQPFVHTCSQEKKDNVGMVINKGCPAWGGCAIVQFFKDRKYRKPTNVIVERAGRIDSVPCFGFYTTWLNGRPTSQVHLQHDGWRIITDRTTIPQKIRVDGIWREVDTEVPNLAPFYEGVKAKQSEVKPKRGRPRKVKAAEPARID